MAGPESSAKVMGRDHDQHRHKHDHQRGLLSRHRPPEETPADPL